MNENDEQVENQDIPNQVAPQPPQVDLGAQPTQSSEAGSPPEEMIPEMPLQAQNLPQNMTLQEFFYSHKNEYGVTLLGGFVDAKETAGELSGNEEEWLEELRKFGQRPVKTSRR